MSQSDAILEALQRGEVVTPAVAYQRWGCLALHSRIAELRDRGYRIDCTIETGGGKRWGSYALVGPVQMGLFPGGDLGVVSVPQKDESPSRGSLSGA